MTYYVSSGTLNPTHSLTLMSELKNYCIENIINFVTYDSLLILITENITLFTHIYNYVMLHYSLLNIENYK